MCVCARQTADEAAEWPISMLHLPPSYQLRPTLPYTPMPINTHGTIWFIRNTLVLNAASIRSNLSAGSSGLLGYHTAQSSNVVNNRGASELLDCVHIAKGDVKTCQHCQPTLNKRHITNPLRSGLLLASVIQFLEHVNTNIFISKSCYTVQI